MSKDKHPSIFLPQMEAIVFIILQIFFATRAVLKIGEYSRIFPSFKVPFNFKSNFEHGSFFHFIALNTSTKLKLHQRRGFFYMPALRFK